jgi:rhodanese-related sulfurtransferase
MARHHGFWGALAALVPFQVGAHPDDDAGRTERIDTMYRTYAMAFPKVPSVTAAELKTMLASDDPPLVVDVRPEEERRIARIPGAVPAEVFEADPPTDRTVVTYCTIGARSGRYTAGFREKGLDVRNLEGSILAWTHIGGPLVDGEGKPTRQVHVYGAKWNLVAEGYTGVVTDRDGNVRAP